VILPALLVVVIRRAQGRDIIALTRNAGAWCPSRLSATTNSAPDDNVGFAMTRDVVLVRDQELRNGPAGGVTKVVEVQASSARSSVPRLTIGGKCQHHPRNAPPRPIARLIPSDSASLAPKAHKSSARYI
jgi:hypothetical protein